MTVDGPFRLLIVHEDPATLLSLKRDFEEPGGILTVGARNRKAALDRLEEDQRRIDAVLCNWRLPDLSGPQFFAHVALEPPKRRPFYLAFSPVWERDDLHRAIQLDLDGLFTSPLLSNAVTAELGVLRRTGRSMTRARLLHAGGERILAPNPALWAVHGDNRRRRRMEQAARLVYERGQQKIAEQIPAIERRLEGILQAKITRQQVYAVAELFRYEGHSAGQIATSHGLASEQLRRCYTGLLPIGASHMDRQLYGPEVLLALRALLRQVTGRDRQRRSRQQQQHLKKLASKLLADPEDLGGCHASALQHHLLEKLNLNASELRRLNGADMRHVAGRIVHEAKLDKALDHVRLAVLSRLFPTDAENIQLTGSMAKTLAAILGCRPGQSDITRNISGLVDAAADLTPEESAWNFDFECLRPFGDEVRRLGDAVFSDERANVKRTVSSQLGEAIDLLVTANAPGGSLQSKHLEAFTRAFDAGEDCALSRPMLDAIANGIALAEQSDSASVLNAVIERLGGGSAEARARLCRFITRIKADGGTQSLRLTDLTDLMAKVARGETANLPSLGTSRLKPEPSLPSGPTKLSLPAAEPADLSLLADTFEPFFGNAQEIDIDKVSQEVPEICPTDIELDDETRAKLRLLVALLNRCDDDARRLSLLEPVVTVYFRQPRVIAALLETLHKGPDGPSCRCLRHVLGLPEAVTTASDIAALLTRSKVEIAYCGTTELLDDVPTTAPTLNRVALACRRSSLSTDAAALYSRALRISPRRAHLLFNYGRLQIELGCPQEALRLLREAIAVDPDLMVAHRLINQLEESVASEIDSP